MPPIQDLQPLESLENLLRGGLSGPNLDAIVDARAPEEDPIAELKAVIDEAGPEVAALFGPALTLFAGARSASKDDRQKLAELERLIMNPRP